MPNSPATEDRTSTGGSAAGEAEWYLRDVVKSWRSIGYDPSPSLIFAERFLARKDAENVG